MKRSTDTQCDRVYEAEARIWGLRFRQVAAATRYLAAVVDSPFWRERKPAVTRVDLEIDDTRDRGVVFFFQGRWVISLPTWALFERYLLHELAHVLSASLTAAYHGPEFTRAYLDLAREFGEGDLAERLEAALIEHACSIGAEVYAQPHEQES